MITDKDRYSDIKCGKWALLEVFMKRYDYSLEAFSILETIHALIKNLKCHSKNEEQNKIPERDQAFQERTEVLDASLDKLVDCISMFLTELQLNLDELQGILVHKTYISSEGNASLEKLICDIESSLKMVDTLTSNSEEEIHKFMDSTEENSDTWKTTAPLK
ncbi:hypothetical protein CEXT_487541 [Caerostris extrusa]|uniref:Uncharacterized protein n=1 Tax=Caerostris extrusa TaxID=172846 RepID=A0AAV4X560_CAEEX|nr:hypothetical protein CEXT_487541 [Caerostris extrusa]